MASRTFSVVFEAERRLPAESVVWLKIAATSWGHKFAPDPRVSLGWPGSTCYTAPIRDAQRVLAALGDAGLLEPDQPVCVDKDLSDRYFAAFAEIARPHRLLVEHR